MQITVYGPGCDKCKKTEERVRHVLTETGVEATVTHATDFAEMAKAGVLMTPAVAIDGAIKLAGRVPAEDEIRNWLGVR